jgi:hypothetical protein
MIWLRNAAIVRDCSFENLPMFNNRNFHRMFTQNTHIYGPNSCGKKTYVQKWVKQRFPSEYNKWFNMEYEIKVERRINIKLYTREGSGHTELMLRDVGNYERYIVRHIIASICDKLCLCIDGHLSKQYVIIYNIHYLSTKSLTMLRNFTSTYTNCIFILVSSNCSNVHKIIASSGLMSIRFIPPTFDEMKEHCVRLCKESLVDFNDESFKMVFDSTGGHLVNTLSKLSLMGDGIKNPYTNTLNSIVLETMKPNPKVLKTVRPLFYICIVNNVCPTRLLTDICKTLINLEILNGDTQTKIKIAMCTAKYEHRVSKCERLIFHFDAYICNIVSIMQSRTSSLFCK